MGVTYMKPINPERGLSRYNASINYLKFLAENTLHSVLLITNNRSISVFSDLGTCGKDLQICECYTDFDSDEFISDYIKSATNFDTIVVQDMHITEEELIYIQRVLKINIVVF